MTADLIHHHSILLRDRVRMEAYAKAIAKTVKAGDIVVDIGCGFGILSFLAVKAGAKHVYAIEADEETLQAAQQFAEQNRCAKKITFLHGLSGYLKLPQMADVVIAEIFGNIAVNENVLPALIDARTRFLKPKGKLLPEGLALYLAPAAFPPWEETLKRLTKVEGFNFSPAALTIPLAVRSENVPATALLAKPKKIAALDFYQEKNPTFECTVNFTAAKAGRLSGFAGWFEAALAPGISLTTAPDRLPTHWKQAFFPLTVTRNVKKGAAISFYFKSEPDHLPAGPNNLITYGVV